MSTARATGETTWVIDLPDLAATERLAREIASEIGANHLITLTGDLGSGKTTFARALIRTLAGDPALEVPSPTFSIMQHYDTPAFPVVHCDLYRVQKADELGELGWDEAADGALVIVEWADRVGDALSADRLDIGFIVEPEEGPDHRVAVVTGHGLWSARVQIMKARDRLLAEAGWGGCRREHMQGDASTRAYERVRADGRSAILMISPPRPDGPPIRYGKSYSTIARLAEDVTPYVAMTNGLRGIGLNAPAIHAADLKTGLLLIEDLGHETVLVDGLPVPERYAEAVAVLAKLHASDLPDRLPITEGQLYKVPPYDLDALLIEVELMLDWYLPHAGRSGLSASARSQFVSSWRTILNEVMMAPRTWTLRDYHSPNLLWCPDREGTDRIGLIDFQDAVMGHPAYDLVSLLQDARVDVAEAMELQLLGRYVALRRQTAADFDLGRFARDYAVMGAQRATKILGIFARLNQRDGKPHYLKHLPRIEAYTRRCLTHAALSELAAWYQKHVPGLFPEAAPAV